VLWGDDGPVAIGRVDVPTFHPAPGRAEQDPDDWWSSTVAACAQVREQDQAHFDEVTAIGFSTARETFVPVAADGRALGPALLWSDRRAGKEAAALIASAGGTEVWRARTGMILDAGAMIAKVAWLAAHQERRLQAARWLLAPRDFVFRRLTGEVATDSTLASRTGFYTRDGEFVSDAGVDVEHLLPPVRSPLTRAPLRAEQIGLRPGIPVVLGAGDRQCEVLGTSATDTSPMVSWGTTANVSVPAAAPPKPLPAGLTVSRAALGGHLLEAGLSASGAALTWLQRLTGLDPLALVDAAAASEPGARGVVALPWLNGARAPWWRSGARAAVLNLTPAHGPGDVARALFEAVAYDVTRSLDALPSQARSGTRPTRVTSLTATGGGVSGPFWVELLAAVTDVPVVMRRSGEAASAGACLLAGNATELHVELDRINPVVATSAPDPSMSRRYRDLRPLVDRVAAGVLNLDLTEWTVE
jgi:xylulokinase